jgi:hypothetical protein
MIMSELSYLKRLCRRWGGSIEELSAPAFQERFSSLEKPRAYLAPFTQGIGVDWEAKVIYSSTAVSVPWPAYVHEMGHVFASQDNPGCADEVAFFGWESVLAERAGDLQAWMDDNREYVIDAYDSAGILLERDEEFGRLSRSVQKSTLAYYVGYSKKLGLLGPRNGLRVFR